MPDDPGVLGNLPRSRPGRRSDKRGTGKPAAKTKPAAARSASKGRTSSARGKTASSSSRRSSQRPSSRPQAGASSGGDPVAGAIRLAGQAAALPFRVAGEVIKRLPGR